MTQAKHTPGPWNSVEHELGTFVKCSKGYIVSGPVNNRPDGEANARLVAAAPELLEALIYYRDECSGFEPSISVFHRMLEEAIAKATGSAA